MRKIITSVDEANDFILSEGNKEWASALSPEVVERLLLFKAGRRSITYDELDRIAVYTAIKEIGNCPAFKEDIILYRGGYVDDPAYPIVAVTLLRNVADKFCGRAAPINIIRAKKGSRAIPITVLDHTKISEEVYDYHPDSEAEYLIETRRLRKIFEIGKTKYFIYI